MTKKEEQQALREENRTRRALGAERFPLQEPVVHVYAPINDLGESAGKGELNEQKSALF